MATDGAGNVYTTGAFSASVDFDPGSGQYVLSTAPSAFGNRYATDVFVSKLDANGNFVVAASIDSAGYNNNGAGVAVDGAGNVYTTGGFRQTADFDPSAGTYNLTAQGYSLMDVFVAKWTQSSSLAPVSSRALTVTAPGGQTATTAPASEAKSPAPVAAWVPASDELPAWLWAAGAQRRKSLFADWLALTDGSSPAGSS